MARPCDLSATEARQLIGRKALSPVELLESCIAQIEAVNPAVNAVVTTAYERARDEARQAERQVMAGGPLGLLHGLPIGIKDLAETAGIRTTHGSLLYRDHVPVADDPVVSALREAGGIVLAKTNTPEFGAGAHTNNAVFGVSRNPFDLARTCGGSSGGSAIALATHMMPLAHGSDTGGSLRLPAAFNGIVSHRPSAGVVPSVTRDIAMSFLEVEGPMARSVADCSLMLAAMATRNRDDPMAYPLDPAQFVSLDTIDLSGLRVAVSDDLGCAPTSQAVRQTFRRRVERFAPAFRRLTWITPPLGDALDVFWLLRGAYMLAKHSERFERHEALLGTNVRGNMLAAQQMDLTRMAIAHRDQLRLYRAFQGLFDEIDVLIAPTVTVFPFAFDQPHPTEIDGAPMANYVHWAGLTSALTVVGNPVTALPCGLDPTGMPFGIQVIGPSHGDRFTLGVAHALEQLFSQDTELKQPVPARARSPQNA